MDNQPSRLERPWRVGVVLCEQHSLASFALVMDILRMANVQPGGPFFEVHRISESGRPVAHADGVLAVDGGAGALAQMDAVLIPSLWSHGPQAVQGHPKLVAALASLPPQVLLAGFCSGVYLLAAAGRLDGRRATTHWLMAEGLARRYPKVLVQAQHNLTHDGPVVCSGGSLAAIDGCLHVVQCLAGRAVARGLSRLLVTDMTRGPQSQYAPALGWQRHQDEAVQALQAWIEASHAQVLTLQDLAEAVHLGVRTLQRRFQAATGMSPLQYQQKVRLERSKDLLEDTRASVTEVAALVGYADRVAFGRLFKQHTGLTPAAYRQQRVRALAP